MKMPENRVEEDSDSEPIISDEEERNFSYQSQPKRACVKSLGSTFGLCIVPEEIHGCTATLFMNGPKTNYHADGPKSRNQLI